MFNNHAQYLRLRVPVWATDREVIKAAHRMIRKGARYSREHRQARHRWLRGMILMHRDALRVYNHTVRGY